ncbi:hypothetical protein AB0K11_05685 [Mycobacterium sp. NPDC050551]|uniref:hypothetical protein n=1 Tax=Mycobacterium sp. NPDC050551 TaxID=3155407 RepID=UPI0034336DBB
MTMRTLLVGLASTALLAGCQAPEAEQEATGPILAFRAANEIGLAQGGTLVATEPGEFAATGEPILTEDGRFVFARSEGRLAVLDTESRYPRTIEVPVGPWLGTGGGSTVVWVEEPDRLMQLDLAVADPAPTLRRTLDLPKTPVPSGPPLLVASRGDTAVVARAEAQPLPSNGPHILYSVRADEPPKPLGNTNANTPVERAVISPDGESLAYAVFRESGADCGSASLTIVSLDGAAPRTVTVGSRDPAMGDRVLYLWWTGITPELSFDEWKCADPWIRKAPTVSEVRGLSLYPTLQGAALQIIDVGPGITARLEPSAFEAREPVGLLILDDKGEKTPVHTDVSAVAPVS